MSEEYTIISDTAKREMNLDEVAFQYGPRHRAAKEYTRISHAIRMLRDSRWWEVVRRYGIKEILVDAIRKIDGDCAKNRRIEFRNDK